jgi:hypothetical protein
MNKAIRRTWLTGSSVSTTLTNDITGVCWHNDRFVAVSENGTTFYWSVDGSVWESGAGTVLPKSDPISITSDGSRIVIGFTNDPPQYTDNFGSTYTQCTGFAAAEATRVFYLPQTDIWVATDETGTFDSADGATFATNGGAGYNGSNKNEENPDQSVIMSGERFSTNQGTSWADMTNLPFAVTDGLAGYMWSNSLDNFIAWDATALDTELYLMSGTPGTWNASSFVTITDTEFRHMFELHGNLYASANNRTVPGTPGVLDLLMSEDGGTTWEAVSSLGSGATGFGTIGMPATPVNGWAPGTDATGYVVVMAKGGVLRPMFPGASGLAAPLT